MKQIKFFTLLLLATLTIFTSCSKDEDKFKHDANIDNLLKSCANSTFRHVDLDYEIVFGDYIPTSALEGYGIVKIISYKGFPNISDLNYDTYGNLGLEFYIDASGLIPNGNGSTGGYEIPVTIINNDRNNYIIVDDIPLPRVNK